MTDSTPEDEPDFLDEVIEESVEANPDFRRLMQEAAGRRHQERPKTRPLADNERAMSQTTASQLREQADPSVFDGWDFEALNRRAAELHTIRRERGYDAMVSHATGRATVVVRRDDPGKNG